MLSKKGIQDFFIKCSWDFIKDIIKPYILPALSSIGGYMLTQNIIAWLLIFSGSSGMIYMLRKFIINLKKDIINDIFSVKNKLIINENMTVHCQYFKDREEVAISLSYFIYNYSFSIIEASFNKDVFKYKIIIPDDIQKNKETVIEERKPNYPYLPPYLPLVSDKTINTYPIYIDVKNKNKMTIKIEGNLSLDYNNINNKSECCRVEKILQGTFNLSKTTNDQNQPVIIIQPVLPID
jgi:hypothetical protein